MTLDLALSARRPLLPSAREAFCIAAVAILLPLFFIRPPSSSSALLWISAASNLGHVVFFALLTTVIHGRYPLHSGRRWIAMTLAALILSGVIELIQGQIGRTVSVADILRNLAGTWAVIVWQQTERPLMRHGRVLVVGFLSLEIVLLALSGYQHYRRLQNFPIINTVETVADFQQWRSLNSHLKRSKLTSSEGSHALQVEILPGDFSGAILNRFPADWQGFTHLLVDIHNPQSEVLTLTLRIHDREHEREPNAYTYADRFNRALQLQPGWNPIRIPLDELVAAPAEREMNLAEIKEMRFFVADSKKPKVIFIDNLRLVSD